MSNVESRWEIDEHGRRFRHVGHGCVEYYPTISTPYGEFEASSVPSPPKSVEMGHSNILPCPFLMKCSEKCARYGARGCGIVTGEPPKVGKLCPFGDKHNLFQCTNQCALWALCSDKKENDQ